MSNRISQAVAKCQEKEKALQRTPDERKVDNIINSGLALGLATAGVISFYVTGPSMQEVASNVLEFREAVKATYPNAGYYALGALAMASLTMLGLYKIEKKEQKINGVEFSATAARDIRETAKSIINVDNTINLNIDNHRNFTAEALARSDDHAVSIMKKHGLDPSDKGQMQRVQRAYSYGVTIATLAQAHNADTLKTMSPDQKEDFTNRKIVEAMVKHFESGQSQKGILSSAKDKIRSALTGNDFNPHAVARSSVRAASQIMSKSQERERDRHSLGM